MLITGKSKAPGAGSPGERRSFNRHLTKLAGHISIEPDFSQSWPIQIDNISLNGMRVTGDLPIMPAGNLHLRIDGTDSSIPCTRISQDSKGLRVKIDIDNLDIDRLLRESDVYASLILEAIPDNFSPR